MSNYVKQEMTTEACASEEEKLSIIDQFIQSTYANATTPQTLKDPSVWMSVLKRLIIRVIAANVDLNVPLQIYLERTDMWNEDLILDINHIDVDEHILLKHTYIILKGIETQVSIMAPKRQHDIDDSATKQSYDVRDWCDSHNEKINQANNKQQAQKKGKLRIS
ncbi:unnamed protein product [Didymodactylos carnosus]|uniref:Uncharacterized protein n=1 Tax=Didymodactylos carnosus TaxID=1234261 RepID=A0A8S2P177_9BILA|nr:unnamed protein product [Didymodactylos carnosus]CAF4030943.1 unnamed protein product [Didymodactylos carnosus]